MFRFVFVSAALAASLAASAADAFSNVEGSYDKTGYVVSPISMIGYRFTSGLSGALTGLKASINNYTTAGTTPKAFTLSLYTNTTDGRLGSLLGSYTGLSTGKLYNKEKKALATVSAATGPSLSLVAGTSYWIVATSTEQLVWNWVDDGPKMSNYYTVSGGAANYGDFSAAAFSVQVGSGRGIAPVPEPASMLALGLGAAGILRRRRKARDFRRA